MKKSLIFRNLIAILVLCTTVFTSCVKNNRDGAVDFSQIAAIMQIPEGSLDPPKFGGAGLVFDHADLVDYAYFRVNYAAATVAPADITVTLAVDNAALLAYNAANPTAQFLPFPANIYSFTSTSVVVKAGQSYSDPIKLTVYPYLVDPALSFMLPITITNASGVNISGNFGTVWYHFIGNKLAGTYNVVGFRYNFTNIVLPGWTGGAIPACCYATAALPATKVLAALDSKNCFTDYANLGPGTGRDIYIFYDDAVSLTALTCSFTPAFAAGISNVIFPDQTYNPVLKRLHILSAYNNLPAGAGADRIVDETWTHQ